MELDQKKISNIKKKLKNLSIDHTDDNLPKPKWIKVTLPSSKNIQNVRANIKSKKLHTVCEEASCPNLYECYNRGTATFLIMGKICTRRCAFCDIEHGKPLPLDQNEPFQLAQTIKTMKLKYVVITSVTRDELNDGGARHFSECIKSIREINPHIKIEILVPDFRGKIIKALDNLSYNLPDVFNHNLETIPRFYPQIRLGADYEHSLTLLQSFKKRHPNILTKSGIMLGLGEEIDEIKKILIDLRKHNVDMITIGQYLAPTKYHYPVKRYAHPSEFTELALFCKELGFSHVASAPLVRSSYHADLQFEKNIC